MRISLFLLVALSSEISCSNSKPWFFLKYAHRILFWMPFFHLLTSRIAPNAINMEPRPQPIPIAIPICICCGYKTMLMLQNVIARGFCLLWLTQKKVPLLSRYDTLPLNRIKFFTVRAWRAFIASRDIFTCTIAVVWQRAFINICRHLICYSIFILTVTNILSLFQIIRCFSFSRYIDFTMYLDISV